MAGRERRRFKEEPPGGESVEAVEREPDALEPDALESRDQPVPLDVSTDEPGQEPMAVSIERARAAKDAARDAYSKVGEILGVGITRVDGDYAVKINLRDEPKAGTEMPTHVQGVPIRVEVTGRIVAR